ncbi:tetraacyldisaccharide 4'-kinase [Ventosimonas gracilis]|uniref:Tetraacyldisaccharide 4'-kinase n=1 Tax=Ventosimonas gracilis TaxID=1680762 RepID=A0A139SXZ8_9GAMM|nr:tetraacyldisaccharide 4'-kinase [Ventosimonas gracilis]KXU39508.1 tetraacyldisaccharide 4'-kinase [Ventosimonas gracilis]
MLSQWLQTAWYNGHPALHLLRPLEGLYRAAVRRRRQRFLRGEGVYRPPLPLLVVGNITVGGTGKTPLILWLIEHCRKQGLHVGVVSRGYGAKPPALPFRVTTQDSAKHCGDEPLMLVKRTGVPLIIDPNRPRAVQALLQQEPLDLILSDDGLQHYRLARDLELLLIDHARGLGNRRCLPAGPLREPLKRLKSVDACLINGANEDSEAGFALSLKPVALVHLQTGRSEPLGYFPAGQKLHALAAIGNPERFFHTLEALNWRPIRHPLPDHARLRPEQLLFSPDLPLLMTEKDAVKCAPFALQNYWYLKVEAVPSKAFVTWFDQQLARLIKGGSNEPETA